MFICLQDALILYARLQLNFTRGSSDGSFLVEQLLDVVCKELDQGYTFCSSVPWWVFSFSYLVCFFFNNSVLILYGL